MSQPRMKKGIHMKSLISAALVGAALAFSAGVQAQAAPAAAAEFTNAEIRKVDKDARKITLKHEEIKILGMPAMAMVFEVKEAAVLDKFKAGDKVRFKAVWESGKYFVTEIVLAR